MIFKEKFNINSGRRSSVLIAPLDWGLGHAARCIPIIKHLKSIGCEVIIASDGIQLELLIQEFPALSFVRLSGYRITFSNNRVKTLIKILWQIPKILISINRERRWLQHFLLENNVDVVISDNRYGLFSKNIASVFITHQLTIKTPFGKLFEKMLRKINYVFINRFSECWIPDFEGKNNFGGELSHPLKKPAIPVKFLGRLSRIIDNKPSGKGLELLIILSGPEPQRSIFEQILLTQLQTYMATTVLVRGLPGGSPPLVSNNKCLSIFNHLPGHALNDLINDAKFIVSRSGYSTIMDLIGLNKKVIFVPTPGQSEQEYLADYLSTKQLCISYHQGDFQLRQAIIMAKATEFRNFHNEGDFQYQKIITAFINGLAKIVTRNQ